MHQQGTISRRNPTIEQQQEKLGTGENAASDYSKGDPLRHT
jgi:hypothetical protein